MRYCSFSIPILFSCVSQMLNVLRKIHLHVYRLLRLVLDFDRLISRKKKSEIKNKLIKPTQLEKTLKAIRDGHTIVFKACQLYRSTWKHKCAPKRHHKVWKERSSAKIFLQQNHGVIFLFFSGTYAGKIEF